MVINEKKMNVTSFHLSGYEMNTLQDARKTLNLIFNRLTASENLTKLYTILSGLDILIEELEANNNSILEFTEDK